MFLGGAGSLSALPASQPPLLFFRGSGGFTALVPTVRSRSQLRRIHRGVIFFYISYFSVYQTTRKIRTVHKGRKVNSSGIKGVTQFARKRKSPDKFQISLHLSGLSFAQPAHSTR